MDKKELKLYVTPAQEFLEVDTEGFLCASISTDPDDWEAPKGDDLDEE